MRPAPSRAWASTSPFCRSNQRRRSALPTSFQGEGMLSAIRPNASLRLCQPSGMGMRPLSCWNIAKPRCVPNPSRFLQQHVLIGLGDSAPNNPRAVAHAAATSLTAMILSSTPRSPTTLATGVRVRRGRRGARDIRQTPSQPGRQSRTRSHSRASRRAAARSGRSWGRSDHSCVAARKPFVTGWPVAAGPEARTAALHGCGRWSCRPKEPPGRRWSVDRVPAKAGSLSLRKVTARLAF